MDIIFDYLNNVEYILFQLFESGFSVQHNITDGLKVYQKKALELGMKDCEELLDKLGNALNLLKSDQIDLKVLLKTYCNLVLYFDITKDLLIARTISQKI